MSLEEVVEELETGGKIGSSMAPTALVGFNWAEFEEANVEGARASPGGQEVAIALFMVSAK